MTKEYRAKVFKSGNSLALRLPKALGLTEGMVMTVREERATYVIEPVDAPKRKIDVSKFAGKAPWLREVPGDEFEESPRDWHLLDRKERDV